MQGLLLMEAAVASYRTVDVADQTSNGYTAPHELYALPISHMTRLAGLAAAVTTVSLACTPGQSTRALAEPPSKPTLPSISLSEVDAGQWMIVFRTSRPTADLRFVRNPDDSRSRRWHVDRDFVLVHEEGTDFLRRKDRGVFRTASVTVPARYVELPKEYAAFSPYSDGGTLIYSGQFHVCTEKQSARVTVAGNSGSRHR